MSCAKEDEEPGRGGSRTSRDPKGMLTTSLRSTKTEVVEERSDEKDHTASYFRRLTWSMQSSTKVRPNLTQGASEAMKPVLRSLMGITTHKELEWSP